MLGRLGTEPDFLNRIIIDEESWFFEYDPETKRQSEDWHTPQTPRQKEARKSKLKVKNGEIIIFAG
jgi:hypothetical protein